MTVIVGHVLPHWRLLLCLSTSIRVIRQAQAHKCLKSSFNFNVSVMVEYIQSLINHMLQYNLIKQHRADFLGLCYKQEQIAPR